MSKTKKLSLILGVLIVLVVVAVLALFYVTRSGVRPIFTQAQNVSATVTIGGQKINLEIVTTTQDMARGLSNRDSLPADSGMLFVYSNYVSPGFWMKDMRFPIDIIWIRDAVIIGAQENAPVIATGTLPLYYPSQLVNDVLEVNAGFVKANNIKAGDRVEFKNLK